MKKTIIIVVALAVLLFAWILLRETQAFFNSSILNKTRVTGSSESPTPAKWISYTSPTSLFSVSFPAQPSFTTEIERDSDGFAKRTNETYIAEDENKTLYTIYFIRYLANSGQIPLPPNTLLNNLMYEILDAQKGSQLLGFKRTNFKGRSALEFSIENNNLVMDAITFINNNDLYLLSAIGQQNTVSHKDFERFVQSFEFKE